jgi:hypothetical protein
MLKKDQPKKAPESAVGKGMSAGQGAATPKQAVRKQLAGLPYEQQQQMLRPGGDKAAGATRGKSAGKKDGVGGDPLIVLKNQALNMFNETERLRVEEAQWNSGMSSIELAVRVASSGQALDPGRWNMVGQFLLRAYQAASAGEIARARECVRSAREAKLRFLSDQSTAEEAFDAQLAEFESVAVAVQEAAMSGIGNVAALAIPGPAGSFVGGVIATVVAGGGTALGQYVSGDRLDGDRILLAAGKAGLSAAESALIGKFARGLPSVRTFTSAFAQGGIAGGVKAIGTLVETVWKMGLDPEEGRKWKSYPAGQAGELLVKMAIDVLAGALTAGVDQKIKSAQLMKQIQAARGRMVQIVVPVIRKALVAGVGGASEAAIAGVAEGRLSKATFMEILRNAWHEAVKEALGAATEEGLELEKLARKPLGIIFEMVSDVAIRYVDGI